MGSFGGVAFVLLCVAGLWCVEAQSFWDPGLPFLYQSLYLAEVTFCPTEKIFAWNCSWCEKVPSFRATAVLWNSTTGTRGIVAYSPKSLQVVVGFRGSDDFQNWILDLDPRETRQFHNATLHSGWLEGYLALLPQIETGLKKAFFLCPQCRQILFTGHSLGAAISGVAAVDCALSLQPSGVVPSGVSLVMVNFGQPRIGLMDFAQLFERTIPHAVRVVHYADIVPHYPFTQFGYRHAQYELWETQLEWNATLQGPMRKCVGGEDPQCSDSIPFYGWRPAQHMTYLGVPLVPCE